MHVRACVETGAPVADLKRSIVGGLHHPCRLDRGDFSVQLAEHLLPVDRDAPRHQSRGIDHVSSTSRMHHERGTRQRRQQRARTSSMIEVDVREHHVRDHGAGNVQRFEGGEHSGHRGGSTGVDNVGR